MSISTPPPSDGGSAQPENTLIPPPAATASGLTIRISRPNTSAPPTPPATAPHASVAGPSSESAGSTQVRREGPGSTEGLGIVTVPPPTARVSTPPPRSLPSAQVSTPSPMRSTRQLGERKPSSSVPRPEVKRKATFTSVLNFHKPDGAPSLAPAEEEKELGRASRRSKVQAISKLDRAGTPGSATSGGATGTSFVPTKPGSAPDSGPGPSRNPLHRPPVVNPPFDINSVRTSAPRHPPPRSTPRLYGLREAPTYYPTAEQFADPLGYVASLPAEARDAGICKVVPPEGWKMPFCVESDTFRFKTRLQRLNQLEAASRAKVNFLEQLTMFHLQQGDASVTIPVIDRRPLDVWRLRKEVTKMGGYDNVTAIKGWERVTELMGHAVGWSYEFKAAYAKIVLPFEQYMARAKSQSASPLTPLASKKTETQHPPGWGVPPASPTAGSSKKGRMGAMKPAKGRMSGISTRTQRGGSPELATSVSMPELKVTDLASAASSRGGTPQPAEPATAGPRLRIPGFSDREGTDSDLSDDSLSPPPPSAKKLPPLEPYAKGEVCEVCRKGSQGDKILLCDGCDRGYHIFCLDPPLAAVPVHEEWFCTPCLLSQGDDFGFEEGEEHSLASFAARDQAFSEAWWHKYRGPRPAQGGDPNGTPATPARADADEWMDGSRSPSGPLSPFASTSNDPSQADVARPPTSARKGRGVPLHPLSRRMKKAIVSEDDVETEFWRLTESPYDTVEIEYGADVHSTTHGSAAPTMETHPLNPYSKDGWNLNNMPILPDSVLRYIKSDISGMTVPWIYIGMMFSAFCWHNEDHYTYSINYMFWGETKTWYGIPGADAEKFEAAIKGEAPELFEQQPGLLYQLVTMMNPGRLKDEGVDVVACDQRPNEFVITFPKAYHCGFNHGINFNEAVNFALPDWLSQGKEAVRKYREYSKAPVFSHNELLISITLYSDTIKTAIWLRQSLADMVAAEAQERDKLRARIVNLAEKLEEEDCPEEQYQCCVCKAFSYLSQVTCKCTKLVACLDHADQLCGCPRSSRTMRKRYSESQLEEILAIVETRAAIPGQWRERFEAVLSSRRPMLKTMRGLLTDGERMPYPLPELASLKTLVDRANGWVDKVQSLQQRKTAGGRRRKRQDAAEDDGFARTPEYVKRLLKEVERLAFDAPEIHKLREEVNGIDRFKTEAKMILSTPTQDLDIQHCQTVVILGQGSIVDMPEVAQIQTLINRLQWFRQVEDEVDDRTLQYDQVVKLLKEAKDFGIPDDHETTSELRKREEKGRAWKFAVEKLEKAKSITIAELDSLIDGQELTPTVEAIMHNLENISKNIQHWRAQASSILAKGGTAASAQRLIKVVHAAGGIAGKVVVPEVDKLIHELEFHDEWLAEAANLLGETPNKVSTRLNEMLNMVRQRLAFDDVDLNEDRTCFCRASTASPGMLVCCDTCEGWYHPKCVNLNARKEMPAQWKCPMCAHAHGILDGRPSLHDLAQLTDSKWNLAIQPSERTTLLTILDLALEAGRTIVPLCGINAPDRPRKRTMIRDADGNEVDEEKQEIARVTHWCRKLYTMPINFDAVNYKRNERFVFEEWLFRRMRQARQPSMPTPPPDPLPVEVAAPVPTPAEPLDDKHLSLQHRQLLANGVPIMSEKMRLSRSRRPKLILAEAHEKEMACICRQPPVDALITVWCNKCEQGYHASCVSAPLDAVSTEFQGKDFVPSVQPPVQAQGQVIAGSISGTGYMNGSSANKQPGVAISGRKALTWRCPCCTVKEGKFYLKGIELRVQMEEHVGTDTYIDYRATIANYVASPILLQLPPATCILLHCVQFIPAVKPEDVVAPNKDLATSHHGAAAAAAGLTGSSGGGHANKKRRTDSVTSAGGSTTVPASVPAPRQSYTPTPAPATSGGYAGAIGLGGPYRSAVQSSLVGAAAQAIASPAQAQSSQRSAALEYKAAVPIPVMSSYIPPARPGTGTSTANSAQKIAPVEHASTMAHLAAGAAVRATPVPATMNGVARPPTQAFSGSQVHALAPRPAQVTEWQGPATTTPLDSARPAHQPPSRPDPVAIPRYEPSRPIAVASMARATSTTPSTPTLALTTRPAGANASPKPQSSYVPQRNVVSPRHPVNGLNTAHTIQGQAQHPSQQPTKTASRPNSPGHMGPTDSYRPVSPTVSAKANAPKAP